MTVQLNSEALQHIRVLVRGGFESRARMTKIVCEELYAPGELDPRAVSAAIDAEIAAVQSESASWPPVTDCERLEAAFAAMKARGIVALQNAGYTQSDGYDDVRDYADRANDRAQWIGYCFYDGQDLERAVDGAGLHLAFGPLDPEQEQSAGLAIGRSIIEELERAGLEAEWDGTFNQRIHVPELDWKQRLGEGVVAEIAVAVRKAIAGGERRCVTFVLDDNQANWVQFVDDVLNGSWPSGQDPGPIIAKIGHAVVDTHEPWKYATAKLQTPHALQIARSIDAYCRLALGAEQDYSVEVALEWI